MLVSTYEQPYDLAGCMASFEYLSTPLKLICTEAILLQIKGQNKSEINRIAFNGTKCVSSANNISVIDKEVKVQIPYCVHNKIRFLFLFKICRNLFRLFIQNKMITHTKPSWYLELTSSLTLY